MLSTSFAFRNRVAKNSKTIHKAQLTFADGTTVDLSGEDLMAGPSFSEGTSSSSSFDVGGAVIGRHEFVLRNEFGQYDDADFTGATVIAYVGVDVDGEGSVEWLRKGIYGVEQPKTYGNTIKLSALDNMRLLEVPYSEVSTAYPATLGTIVSDACMECGMTLLTQDFDGHSITIPVRPDDSALSCLDVVSYAAQATGHFAKCDPLGRLVFKWYDTAAFESEEWLDGGTFSTSTTPYSDGDTADGGAFHDDVDSFDGGSFAEGRFAHLYAWSQLSVATDDVVITGIRVTADDELLEDGTRGEEGETALFGDEGYILEISGNPLIVYGTASAAAARIGGKVVGMRFRPFDGQVVGDPSLEAGDPVVITDRRQQRFLSYITQTTWRAGSYQAVSCGAETPSRNKAATYSALTRAIVENRGRIRAERDARAYALQVLQQELADSGGLYETDVEQEDHSIVHFLHDKPTLAESQIVWKLTAEAFGVSVNGVAGPYLGFDAWGNAILNSIYAIGLNADHITAGTLRSENGDFQLNLSTGVATVSGGSTIGDRTVASLLGEVDGTITDVQVQFNRNQSNATPPAPDDVGWTTTSPTWQAGYYIWQRIAKYSASGTEYSDVVCISGRDGASGTNAAAVYLYARSSTTPTKDMASELTYTFATGAITGSLGSWSRSIPSGTDTCWVVMATAISNTGSDVISRSEWSDPLALTTAGVDGLNQATVMLFQRKAAWRVDVSTLVAPANTVTVSGTTATVPGTVSGTTLTLSSDVPAKPNVQTTYTFASGDLTPIPSGWSRSIPSGDDPVYVTSAAAISASATDVIEVSPTNEWADVVKLSEDGIAPKMYSVRYAVSTSGTTAPTSGWQSTVPATQQGKWLWVRTTFTDGTTSDTCSYMGKDGEDGKSLAIQSSTKTGDTTTVVIADTDGNTTTLTIKDGEDGSDGVAGASGYTHIAWATAADGSTGFSTQDSANKTYVGMYTDHVQADSQDPSDYSWSRIKGTGVATYEPQWYLSTSNATATGGSWSTTQPAWVSGRYIWERTKVTYDDGRIEYAPYADGRGILAASINSANSTASSANTKAEHALALVREYGDGVLVCRQGNTVGALVNADGSFDVVGVSWSGGVPSASTAVASFGSTIMLGTNSRGVRLASNLIEFMLEGDSAFGTRYYPPSYSGATNWKMELQFMEGLFYAAASGQANFLHSNGYPLIFKNGSSLMYWDGQSTTPQQFPLGGSASSTVTITDAISASSGVAMAKRSIVVNGATAMWSDLITCTMSSSPKKVGMVGSSGNRPVKDISVAVTVVDTTNDAYVAGRLYVLSTGDIKLDVPLEFEGHVIQCEMTAMWIRNA